LDLLQPFVLGRSYRDSRSDIKVRVKSEHLRAQLRRALAAARRETDRLFEMLASEAIYERPIPERHRIVFYLGHLEAFDWNMVCAASFGMPSLHPTFDRLFAFGIDPIDGRLPQDQPADWPSIAEIDAYNRRVRHTVDELLSRANFDRPPVPYVEGGQIFHVAIEHRLMHAETLAYMLHWLSYDSKKLQARAGASSFSRSTGPVFRKSRFFKTGTQARIPAGETLLGQTPESGSFGWDNEFRACSVLVPEFSMDVFNVTNGEFLEFVRAGGYQHRPLWNDDGWDWIQKEGIRHPKFWILRKEQWFYRTMFEDIPLPFDWPVYVSHAEAMAYARWKGKTLPSEPQYHRAAFGSPDGMKAAPPDGNFNFKSWTPEPVGASPDRASAFGVYDLVGNGWEWTSTPFAPFEGFTPFPFYPGYSADFFDGRHFVLKGASPRTASLLVRRSFRNWFQPHYPNIYAAFRCVES
jgi:ergothioneine biosynthesis protein EgtB